MSHRLATVTVPPGQRPVDPAIDGVDCRVDDAPSGVQVMWSQGIRVSRQPSAWVKQGVRRDRDSRGDLMRLERLEIGARICSPIISTTLVRRPGI